MPSKVGKLLTEVAGDGPPSVWLFAGTKISIVWLVGPGPPPAL